MESKRGLKWTVVCLSIAAALAPAASQAQSVESFYRSNSLKLIVGSDVGGGYDSYARALGAHIGRHIPGKPNVIVQNMPGASGLKATNYIYNSAPKDGSVLGAVNSQMTLQPLFTTNGVQFDPFKLNWLGTMGKQLNLCFTWYTSPVKTIEDAQKRETTVAATSASGAYALVPNILNTVIHTKFKVISGYDTSGTSLAVARGEVDGLCGISYSTLMTSNPDWVRDKKINFLTELSAGRDPKFPDMPLVIDMVKDPADKKMLDVILVVQEVGRPIIAPPGIAEDRLVALRTAFEETLKDKAFLDEAAKRQLEIDMLTHTQVEEMIKGAYTAPKDVIDRAGKLLAFGQ
jgi:tripartite-type tricarboxylate transporter receptor subunit TctC